MKSFKPVRSLLLLTLLATVFIGLAMTSPEALTPTPLLAMGALIANPHSIPDPILRRFRQTKRFLKRHQLLFLTAVFLATAVIFPPALMATPFIAFGLVTSVDLHGEVTVASLSPIAARTTTVTGAAVDIRDYVGRLKVTQNVGTVSGTTPTLDGKIQDSADGSTGWADVTGATFVQVTATDNLQSIGVDTRACKRYIRYVGTIAGTTPSFAMGVTLAGVKQSA